MSFRISSSGYMKNCASVLIALHKIYLSIKEEMKNCCRFLHGNTVYFSTQSKQLLIRTLLYFFIWLLYIIFSSIPIHFIILLLFKIINSLILNWFLMMHNKSINFYVNLVTAHIVKLSILVFSIYYVVFSRLAEEFN